MTPRWRFRPRCRLTARVQGSSVRRRGNLNVRPSHPSDQASSSLRGATVSLRSRGSIRQRGRPHDRDLYAIRMELPHDPAAVPRSRPFARTSASARGSPAAPPRAGGSRSRPDMRPTASGARCARQGPPPARRSPRDRARPSRRSSCGTGPAFPSSQSVDSRIGPEVRGRR